MSDNIENSELEENIDDAIELEEETPIPEIDSKYRMILLAAQRSKQLQRGATPKIAVDVRKSKSTRIAMEEIKQKTVRFKILDQE
jgi:DNA-directed RNA polymerase omega subunit